MQHYATLSPQTYAQVRNLAKGLFRIPLIVLARICQFNLTTSFENSTRPKFTALQACQILFRLSDKIMTCFGVCMSLRQATLPAQSTSHLDRSPCYPSTSGRSHTDSQQWRNCRSDNPAHLTQRRFAALGRRSRNFGTSLNAASEGKQVWLSVGCYPRRYVKEVGKMCAQWACRF